jgi:hypothetical protein
MVGNWAVVYVTKLASIQFKKVQVSSSNTGYTKFMAHLLTA